MTITIQINGDNLNPRLGCFPFSSCIECPFCHDWEDTDEYGEPAYYGGYTCIIKNNTTVWEGDYEDTPDEIKPINCPIVKVTSSES